MSTVLVVPTYNEAEGILTVQARPHGEGVQQDADFSHPPQRIPALLGALQGVDMVSEAMLLVLIRRWRQITQGKHCIVDRGNTRATS
jgi:hypothetical protein